MGKPSKGTPADRRLKANGGGQRRSASNPQPKMTPMKPVKGAMPMQGKQGRKH